MRRTVGLLAGWLTERTRLQHHLQPLLQEYDWQITQITNLPGYIFFL